MIHLALSAIYFLLPAYAANMAPVFAAHLGFLPHLARAIDGGHSLWGDFILGSGKTWRGLVVGTLLGTIIGGLQGILYELGWITNLSPIPLTSWQGLVLGFLLGLGALLGDSLESFFKRRVGIRSGNSWPVFDQIDFVLGAFALAILVMPFNWRLLLAGLIVTVVLSPIINWLGFHLKIKKVWW